MFLVGSVRQWCLSAFTAGIGFSLLSMGSASYFLNVRHHSLLTTGIVTSVDRDEDGDNYLYCPTVRFQSADGTSYTTACRVWENRYFNVGDTVTIRYKKIDPNDAWPEEQVSSLPREAALWGGCSLGLGFLLLWYMRRRGIALAPFDFAD